MEKVCKGLSAGRVQSVAVRLICEREREIQAFVPQEYWTIEGNFETPKKEDFKAELTHIKGEKIDITTESEAQAVVDAIGGADAVVTNIEKAQTFFVKRHLPFTTSTLQQDGVRKLNFGAKRNDDDCPTFI